MTVLEILLSFIRENSVYKDKKSQSTIQELISSKNDSASKQFREDVQAAMNIVGSFEKLFVMNLSNVDLCNSDLRDLDFNYRKHLLSQLTMCNLTINCYSYLIAQSRKLG